MGFTSHPLPATFTSHPPTAAQIREILEAIKLKRTNELPEIGPRKRFTEVYGPPIRAVALMGYVEREGTTFNVYWQALADAAEYRVEVYKYIPPKWYKLTDAVVERGSGYIALTDLVGDGYVFRVVAENRAGETVARSDGIILHGNIAD